MLSKEDRNRLAGTYAHILNADRPIPALKGKRIWGNVSLEDVFSKRYYCPSGIHNRTLMERLPADQPKAWRDEFGNFYCSRGIKGLPYNNATPGIYAEKTAYTGFCVFGYQDQNVASRLPLASQLLRNAGIQTEWIRGIFQLDDVIAGGQPQAIDDWKEEVRQKIDYQVQAGVVEKTTASKAKKYLKDIRLFLIARDLQTPQRLNDLMRINNEPGTDWFFYRENVDPADFYFKGRSIPLSSANITEMVILNILQQVFINDFQRYKGRAPTEVEIAQYSNHIGNMMPLPAILSGKRFPGRLITTGTAFHTLFGEIIDSINILMTAANSKEFPPFLPFDDTEVLRYFHEFLPVKIARNVALMHLSQLRHNYLSPHNLSASGSIYDLNSLQGEPLGDDPVTEEEMREDFYSAGLALMTIYRKIFFGLNIPGVNGAIQGYPGYGIQINCPSHIRAAEQMRNLYWTTYSRLTGHEF